MEIPKNNYTSGPIFTYDGLSFTDRCAADAINSFPGLLGKIIIVDLNLKNEAIDEFGRTQRYARWTYYPDAKDITETPYNLWFKHGYTVAIRVTEEARNRYFKEMALSHADKMDIERVLLGSWDHPRGQAKRLLNAVITELPFLHGYNLKIETKETGNPDPQRAQKTYLTGEMTFEVLYGVFRAVEQIGKDAGGLVPDYEFKYSKQTTSEAVEDGGIRCECGTATQGFATHSVWCPAHKEVKYYG